MKSHEDRVQNVRLPKNRTLGRKGLRLSLGLVWLVCGPVSRSVFRDGRDNGVWASAVVSEVLADIDSLLMSQQSFSLADGHPRSVVCTSGCY